jgi:hypothetical protein
MPRPSRRRFLLATSAFFTAGLGVQPGLAEGADRQRLRDAAGRGRRFLASMFDAAVGLLPEFRGSEVYWLYHDNYLAAKALDRTEPDLARKVRDAIKGFGVTGSGKIEILFGEAKNPLPFRHHRLVEVKRVGEKVIKTELVGDRIHADWREYTDLLFLAAVAEVGRDRDEALRHFEAGLATWDGTGFKDRINRKGGHYATYKLALALIAASGLNRHPTTENEIVERLLAVQQSDGGFVTDYTAQGRTVGMANVETTSLAVLALDGMTEPRGGGQRHRR